MIYYHQLNPIAFYIGATPVPWYWLNYLLSYLLIYAGALRLSRQQISPVPYQDIPSYALGCWFAVFIFGRLGYILIYHLDHYIAHPEQIHQLWLGGMSFHGALLGCALSLITMAWVKKQSWLLSADLFCVFIPLALAFGRLTNFINGELMGRPTASGLWGVVYGHDAAALPRHPSALYQAALEGFLLFAVLWLWRSQLARPGWITSRFLMGYGALRIGAEFYREPDPQVGYLLGGITMGQLLSLVMVLIGIGLGYHCWRVSSPPGGNSSQQVHADGAGRADGADVGKVR